MKNYSTKNENKPSQLLRSFQLAGFFTRRYKKGISFGFSLIFLAAATEYVSIAVLFNVINEITGTPVAAEKVQGLFRHLYQLISAIPAQTVLISTSLVLLMAFLLRAFFSFYANYFIERLAQRIRMDLQNDLLSRYLAAECSFFSESRQGNLLFNTLQAPATVASMISLLAQTLMSVLTALFLVGLLFSISTKITMILLVLVIIAAASIGVVSKKIAYTEGRRANRSLSTLNIIANEAFTCIRVIKSYMVQSRVENEFRGQSDIFYKSKLRLVVYRHLVTELFATGMVVFFIGFFIQQALSGVASFLSFLPSLSVYMLSLLRLSSLISDLGKRTLDYANSLPNMDLLHHEMTSVQSKAEKDGSIEVAEFESLEFQDVSFSYGEKTVLSHISFKIQKNKMVALVGGSGGGKTTILSLVLKLLRPNSGRILLNGIDLNQIQTKSLLRIAAPVFQMPLLFNKSVAENVALSDQVDVSRMTEALKQSHSFEFVNELPEGMSTEIGDLGDRLSVGQKQRLLLARAFYKNPQLILFDEPTSALDATSEKLIVQSIRELSGQKTLFVVAHRLSTIQNADAILVLKNGQIVESGRHSELMLRKGEYYSLYGQYSESTAPSIVIP